MTTTTAPSTRTLEHDDHALRLTRWHAGDARRQVHLILERGALVDLGSVVRLGPGLFMVYPATPDLRPFRVASFVDGARQLDRRLEVETHILYSVKVRTSGVNTTGTEA